MFKVTFILALFIVSSAVSSQQVDPTRPFANVLSSANSEKRSPLILQSIIQSQNKKKAIINGQTLHVGDKYKGFELIAINTNGVVLDSSQGRMELSLFSGVIANSK